MRFLVVESTAKFKADLADKSVVLLPSTPIWLGIQHVFMFESSARFAYHFDNEQVVGFFLPSKASRRIKKILRFFCLLCSIMLRVSSMA